MSKTSKAGGRKKAVFKKVTELAKQYPIIGVVDMANLPTPQLQRMREQLRGQVEIFMAKKRVIKKAIEKLKEIAGLQDISQYLEKAQPALLFTKDNPFTLFKTLKKNKSKAPAKGGQIAPNDIIVPAGPTPFAPGPVIGELGALGIKSGVEGGKISIKNDTTVCKAGKEISEKLASVLTRLGIEPMEIGLDLKAVYEKGTIYTKQVLDIDEEQFMNNLNIAASEAYNLAIEATYFCKDTTEELIKKAFREAKEVAKQGKIMCDLVAEELVEQAEREMLAVKSQLKDVPVTKEAKPEAPKVEKKKEAPKQEKPKVEEKKEEVKKAPKEEPKAEEKPEKIPKAEDLKKQAEQKKKEEPKEKPHPKQGNVTHNQAADLLTKLQKEGTLRKNEEK
ncbi:50S ribosomal protein L10 [Candidatus Woesearchaeota archaeon]|nr:50S ribosomal protein L10 [Candidatus Woesearchaeota archaeon]